MLPRDAHSLHLIRKIFVIIFIFIKMKENEGGILWDHGWPAQVQQTLRRLIIKIINKNATVSDIKVC